MLKFVTVEDSLNLGKQNGFAGGEHGANPSFIMFDDLGKLLASFLREKKLVLKNADCAIKKARFKFQMCNQL